MNKRIIVNYLKTFFITILVACVFVVISLGLIERKVYNEITTKQHKENTEVDKYLVEVLINKNKALLAKDPTNHMLYYKLGTLYEMKNEYNTAESAYLESIKKAPYGEYRPQYRLALLYVKLNRLIDADNIISNVEEKPDEVVIADKGEVFNSIGDAYYNKSDYENAMLEYEKSIFYYSKIKYPKLKNIDNSLASSYVYLADQKVKQMKIDEAIDCLKKAAAIVNAPIIKYKLALLYMTENPDLSLMYFQEVFSKEPSIIDYNTYYNFLSELADEADAEGNISKADLCRYKIGKLKKYYESNLLSVEDLELEAVSGNIRLNPWTKKYRVNLQFKLKNSSEYNMNSLYALVEFKDKGRLINSHLVPIATKESKLRAFAYAPLVNIKIKYPEQDGDKFPKTLTVDIYALKNPDSYKIFLTQIKLQQKNRSLMGKFRFLTRKFPFLHFEL